MNKSASYRNDIDQAVLGIWCRDPNFDASERAFYCACVLEIPTPTWLAPKGPLNSGHES